MLAVTLLGQEMHWGDLGVVGLLVLLEGVLSIDNALVLGLLAKRLPPEQRKKALTYGLVGAFAFRFLAIGVAAFLLKWDVVKLLGGGYLAYIAVRHLFFETKEKEEDEFSVSAEGEVKLVRPSGRELTPDEEIEEIKERVPGPMPAEVTERRPGKPYAKFWPTVFVIEMTDIAFAVDSILAAIALVGRAPADHEGVHPKLWVIITGGILGVILMRFAAVIFIRLLERFPRFETSAYVLVAIIGAKLLVDWGFNTEQDPHRINFHDTSHPEFWIFWVLMMAGFLSGFLPQRGGAKATSSASSGDSAA